MKKTVRFGEKPVASSSTEYIRTLAIRVGRRPNRSATRPKIHAPSARIASVSVMSRRTNTMMKKSKASRVD